MKHQLPSTNEQIEQFIHNTRLQIKMKGAVDWLSLVKTSLSIIELLLQQKKVNEVK